MVVAEEQAGQRLDVFLVAAFPAFSRSFLARAIDRGAVRVDGLTARASHKNPVCGDEITVMLQVTDGVITDAAFSGRGCSIATASASMMTDVLRGLSTADALAIGDAVDRMLSGTTVTLPDALTPLRGVAPFAGRHGCARLPWQALRDATG